MKNIVRWNPTREISSFWNAFDRMLEDSYLQPVEHARSWGLALDVVENGDAYVLQASIPGINPDEIEVTLEKNVLTLSGETSADETVNAEDYRLRERRFGSFSRSIRFPVDVNADKIKADYQHGVLTLTVPKAETVKPKKIAVKVNGK